MSATASSTSAGIIRYKWYRQLLGENPELVEWTTDGAATYDLGSPGNYTYNFAVSAVTADGESPKSDIIQVVGVQCYTPNRPGGAAGNVALYPTASGFFPSAEPYSFTISNCDIQEKTGKVETGVELGCNAAQPSNSAQPIVSYSYWVKTENDTEFRKVFTSTGTGSTARRIIVDGSTQFPSGTYKVTAASDHGDSEFGNNEITVNIRTDCPEPNPAPSALTFYASQGGVFTSGADNSHGTLTNVCNATYSGGATLYLENATGATSFIWRRTGSSSVERQHQESSVSDLSVVYNGTYSVVYVKDDVESQPAEITINMQLCPPTFSTKPTVIVEPAEYAEVEITRPATPVELSIDSYEWYYNDNLVTVTLTSEEVRNIQTNVNDVSKYSFRLLKEGRYKVKAKSGSIVSEFSEEITLTKIGPPSDVFTRADLVGTYDVTDWRRTNAGGSANNYTLTIAANPDHADSVVITGLGGNRGNASTPWYTTLKAAVSFTTDGGTTGNYGTITIPKQTFLGAATGTTPWYFKVGTNYVNPPTCNGEVVTLTIKLVSGKPGVSQTGVNYGIWSNANVCGGINYWNGARANTPDDVVTWTKQ
jgi:hypothetical protein